MKKTYINPKMEVVKIAVAQMLAASDRGFSNTDAGINSDGDYDDGGSAPADGTAPKTVYTVIWRGANGKELDRKIAQLALGDAYTS